MGMRMDGHAHGWACAPAAPKVHPVLRGLHVADVLEARLHALPLGHHGVTRVRQLDPLEDLLAEFQVLAHMHEAQAEVPVLGGVLGGMLLAAVEDRVAQRAREVALALAACRHRKLERLNTRRGAGDGGRGSEARQREFALTV